MKNFYEFNEHLENRFLKEVSFNWEKEGASEYIEELRDDLKEKIFSLTKGDSLLTLNQVYEHLPIFMNFFSFERKSLNTLNNYLKTLMELRDVAVDLGSQGLSLPANVNVLNDLNEKLGSIDLLCIQLDMEAEDVMAAMESIESSLERPDLEPSGGSAKKSFKEAVEYLISYFASARPIDKIKKNIYDLQMIIKSNQNRN